MDAVGPRMGEEPFVCRVCGAGFATEAELVDHLYSIGQVY